MNHKLLFKIFINVLFALGLVFGGILFMTWSFGCGFVIDTSFSCDTIKPVYGFFYSLGFILLLTSIISLFIKKESFSRVNLIIKIIWIVIFGTIIFISNSYQNLSNSDPLKMKLENTDLESCENEFKQTGDSGCFATYAHYSGDYQYCEKVLIDEGVDGDSRFYCFIEFIEEVPNIIDWCGKISTIKVRIDQCLTTAAKNRNDKSICNNISEISSKNSCLAQIIN